MGGGVSLYKGDGAVGDLRFHRAARIEGQLANLFRGLVFAGIVDGFKRLDFRIPTLFVAERRPEPIGSWFWSKAIPLHS